MPEEPTQPTAVAPPTDPNATEAPAVSNAPMPVVPPTQTPRKKLWLTLAIVVVVLAVVVGIVVWQRGRVSAADVATAKADVQKMYDTTTSKDTNTLLNADKVYQQQIDAIEKLSVMHDKDFAAAVNDFKTNTLPRSHRIFGIFRGLSALDTVTTQLKKDSTWSGPVVTSNAAAIQLFQQKQKAFATAANNLRSYTADSSSSITQDYLKTAQKCYQDIADIYGTAATSLSKGKDTLSDQLKTKLGSINKDLNDFGLDAIPVPDLASTVDPAQLYQAVNVELSADVDSVTSQLDQAGDTFKSSAKNEATKELQPPILDKVKALQAAAQKLHA